MQPTHASDRMPSEDALYLYLEKESMPLHIGSVSIFDGPLPVDRLKKYIEAKLPLIPRYRQRLAFPPLHLGHPTWEYDPEFDIDRHIREVTLKGGTREDLRILSGEILSKMMSREKPLWDISVVNGLEDGQSAVIARVHHCLVDGIGGVGLMNILLDTKPTPEPLPKAEAFRPPPLPGAGARTLDVMITAYSDIIGRILTAQSATLDVAQAVVSDPINYLTQLAKIAPDVFTPVDRLPFNKPVLGPRDVAWSEFSIAEISQIRKAIGGKLNDVVLAMVAGAVARYAELHGENLKNRSARIMVPVNLRQELRTPGVGNKISLLPVLVPLDLPDPAEVLQWVSRRTEAMKRAHVGDLIAVAVTWLGNIPTPLQAVIGLLGNTLPIAPFSLVCTNVPGPSFPLYVLGRQMLTYHPYVPIGNEMGLCVAIESYNGKLYVTMTGDSAAMPDLGRLDGFLKDTFNELKKKAGIQPVKVAPPVAAKAAPKVEAKKAASVKAKAAKAEVKAPAAEVKPPKAAEVKAAAAPKSAKKRSAKPVKTIEPEPVAPAAIEPEVSPVAVTTEEAAVSVSEMEPELVNS